MGEYSTFWAELDAARAREKALLDATTTAISKIVTPGGKWRFVGVRNGTHWIARHRHFDEVVALSSGELIEKIEAAVTKAARPRP